MTLADWLRALARRDADLRAEDVPNDDGREITEAESWTLEDWQLWTGEV